jgi:hypothetical protein
MSDGSHRDQPKALAFAPASSTDRTRRRFLMAFGAGAAGAASAKALAAAPAAVTAPAAETKPGSQGYRETEHVRTYYATTRI